MPEPVGESKWALPDPRRADADGFLGVGADLAPETLVAAYRHGIFPWPHEGMALPWFSPDPRSVVDSISVHTSRSLGRRLRRCGWTTTVDADFAAVVAGCADRPGGEPTWITAEMAAAYLTLHSLGWAHSLEVWEATALVGGIYGVSVGGCFTGESMFHRVTDASKVAVVDLVQRWTQDGGDMVDVQLPTPHLDSLGARTVARAEFLSRLAAVRNKPVCLSPARLPVSRLASSLPQ